MYYDLGQSYAQSSAECEQEAQIGVANLYFKLITSNAILETYLFRISDILITHNKFSFKQLQAFSLSSIRSLKAFARINRCIVLT